MTKVRQKYEQVLPDSKTQAIVTLERFPISVTVAQYTKPGNIGPDKLRHAPIPRTKNESEKGFLSQELPFNLVQGSNVSLRNATQTPGLEAFWYHALICGWLEKRLSAKIRKATRKKGTWA